MSRLAFRVKIRRGMPRLKEINRIRVALATRQERAPLSLLLPPVTSRSLRPCRLVRLVS